MANPPDFIHLFFSSILTDFEDGLSVSIVKTAIDKSCPFQHTLFRTLHPVYYCYKCKLIIIHSFKYYGVMFFLAILAKNTGRPGGKTGAIVNCKTVVFFPQNQ